MLQAEAALRVDVATVLHFPSDGAALRIPHMSPRALRKTKGTEGACLWRLWEVGAAGCPSLSQRIFLSVGTFFPSSVEHDRTFVGAGVGFRSLTFRIVKAACSMWMLSFTC